MTQEEFLNRLEEDKFFDNPQELVDYRLPVVQFFLTNYTNSVLINNNNQLHSRLVTINSIKAEDTNEFTLLNIAYLSIKGLKKGGMLK